VNFDYAAEDAIVRQLLKDSVSAWNSGDLDEFMKPYAQDARFVSRKAVTVGADKILARYKKKYSSRALMGHLGIEVQHLTFVPGDVPTAVTVIGRWTIKRASGDVLSGATLIVFHRRGESWLIIEDHSS